MVVCPEVYIQFAISHNDERYAQYYSALLHVLISVESLQFVEANEFDDASEYDDATSRLGSMSMSSAYSSDDDSPPFRSTGSPGRLTEVPAPLLLPPCSPLR